MRLCFNCITFPAKRCARVGARCIHERAAKSAATPHQLYLPCDSRRRSSPNRYRRCVTKRYSLNPAIFPLLARLNNFKPARKPQSCGMQDISAVTVRALTRCNAKGITSIPGPVQPAGAREPSAKPRGRTPPRAGREQSPPGRVDTHRTPSHCTNHRIVQVIPASGRINELDWRSAPSALRNQKSGNRQNLAGISDRAMLRRSPVCPAPAQSLLCRRVSQLTLTLTKSNAATNHHGLLAVIHQ